MKKDIKKIFKILDIKYLIFLIFVFSFILIPLSTLAAPSPEGGSCWIDDQCLTGLYCQQEKSTEPGKCFKKKTYGAVCGTNHECESNQCAGFHCIGQKQEVAKSCMTDAGCDPGYHCEGAVPAGVGQFAQGTPGKCVAGPSAGEKVKWQPIAPILQINIPTWQPFTPEDIEKLKQTDAEGNVYIPFIGLYIAAIYRWAVGIAALVAVVFVITGGLIYMMAGGNAQRAQQGKDRITSALFGLLLLLGSYALLYTINPDLVRFKSLKVKVIEREELAAGAETSDLVYYGQSAGTSCFLSNFGQTEDEIKNNLVAVQFLNQKYQVHKKMAPALTAAATEVQGLNYQIKAGAAWPGQWRANVNDPKKLSLHSFAIALDINPDDNPNKRRPASEICDTSPCTNPCPTDMPKEIIAALNKNGFRWGGNFRKVCDAMHFEWLGPCAKGQYQPGSSSAPPPSSEPLGCCITQGLPLEGVTESSCLKDIAAEWFKGECP